MKLNLHARIEIAVLAALLLSSCNAVPEHTIDETYDLADVARANSVNALYAAQQLEERVSEIESRLNM